MKKFLTIYLALVLATIAFICGITSLLQSLNKDELIVLYIKSAEQAYFEGQRDAINHDVRIQLNRDSIYVWIKSPWDSNRQPIFIPTRIDTNESVTIPSEYN